MSKFILQTGLGWGAFMFSMNLLMLTPRRYSIPVTFGIWLAGGLICTTFGWAESERRYRRYVDQEGKAREAWPCDPTKLWQHWTKGEG
jgi:hypothetical protein